MSILFAIVLFSLLIFLHELGHFVAAKLSGVQVNEFAIFMGPAIFQRERNGTLYSIRCIPIGGYCAMEGEDGGSDNPKAFTAAKWWKRLIILVAGSFMNFIAGVLIIVVVLSCSQGYVDPVISQIEPDSYLAAEGGLQVGDRLVEFDGTEIEIYEDFILATAFIEDGNYDIKVERDGRTVTLKDVPFIPKVFAEGEEPRYGITLTSRETTAESVVSQIWPQAKFQVKNVIFSLKMLLSGQVGLKDMAGPVGIVQIMSDSAEASESASGALLNMLSIGAMLAINLAVMNLLPIPALDGGRVLGLLLTVIIEKITRKKLDPKYEGYIHSIGMILLLILMAVILFKDVFTIFKG